MVRGMDSWIWIWIHTKMSSYPQHWFHEKKVERAEVNHRTHRGHGATGSGLRGIFPVGGPQGGALKVTAHGMESTEEFCGLPLGTKKVAEGGDQDQGQEVPAEREG